MPSIAPADLFVLLVTVMLLFLLLRPKLRDASLWRATVTPLASIIGSGFLVVAPLLAFMAGRLAVVAIFAIVLVAWLVGSAVRFNIRHLEPMVEADANGDPHTRLMRWLERSSKLALSIAYIIAVAFYLELLGAFVLRMFDIESHIAQKSVATILLIFIGTTGLWRGLRVLEGLEEYAVAIKLAVIAGFLAGLATFNIGLVADGHWQLPSISATWDMHTLFQLLGAFLIVQGFETSRYLHGVYSPELRIHSMRLAQGMSAVIYVAFIALATPLFGGFTTVSETGIIDLSRNVSWVLPWLLVVGAVMAQFSAAVADTISSGGLAEEASRGHIRHRYVYIVSTLLAGLLLWLSDIFAVISYASRAFAAYYAIQCVMAAIHALRPPHGASPRWLRGLLYLLLALLMLLTVIFGIPVESNGA